MSFRRLKKRCASHLFRWNGFRRAFLELQSLPARGPFRGWAGRRSWSEGGEDEVLLALSGDGPPSGFYLDVGANLPTRRSNTFRLYCRGMRGVCIEPNLELAALYERARPDGIVVCAAVGKATGVALLHRYNFHVFSTCSEAESEHLAGARERMRTTLLRRSPVPMVRLDTLEEQGYHVKREFRSNQLYEDAKREPRAAQIPESGGASKPPAGE